MRIFESSPLTFGCSGRQRRFENAVLAMGRHEAEQVLAEHDAIEVTCEFCQQPFAFDRVDVTALFRAAGSGNEQQH